MNKVKNKLQVVHYPNIPCQPFCVDVKDEEQALLIVNTLANQHLFLYENNFIPDYSNVIAVLMLDESPDGDADGVPEWVDYWNEEEGMQFEEFAETYLNVSF